MTDLADGPVLLISGEKITASHRARDAYVYLLPELRDVVAAQKAE